MRHHYPTLASGAVDFVPAPELVALNALLTMRTGELDVSHSLCLLYAASVSACAPRPKALAWSLPIYSTSIRPSQAGHWSKRSLTAAEKVNYILSEQVLRLLDRCLVAGLSL
jgi:hypothetical protein